VARAATALACGVAWLVAAVLALPAPQPVGVPAVGGLAVVLGVLLPLLAWVAGERRWPLPAPLRLVVALSSIPALAVAGWALVSAQWSDTLTSGAHATMTGTELVTASAAAGVLIGALLAYVAASGVTTLAVLTAALVGAVTVGILTALKADSVQSAALVAVVAFLLLTAAPATAGRIVASAFRHGGLPSGAADEGRDQVRAAVRTAMVLLAVWGVLLALVLGSSLVILGSAPNVYGNAIAGCLGVALLLRAGSAKVVVEVVPGAVAGMAGLFTLLLIGPGHLGWPGVTVPLALVVVGVCLLGYGFRRLMRRDLPALRRPGWFGALGAVLGAMSIPLILAGFGVFGTLMGMGEHL
jgi:hypothetical protein